MTLQTPPISRRQLLASVGAVGVVGLGFRRATVTGEPPAYTDYTYAMSDDGGPRLRVAWYSTYNGRLVNATPVEGGSDATAGDGDPTPPEAYVDGYDPETYGPLVSHANVLPGDSGTVALGLFAEEMDARLRLIPTVDGDLGRVVDLAVWYDTGLFGIGGCAGTDVVPESPDVETTLAAFGEEYGPGSPSPDGFPLREGFGDCLPEGDRLCLGFAWRIDESVTNEWQGRGVGFELAVAAEQCEGSL